MVKWDINQCDLNDHKSVFRKSPFFKYKKKLYLIKFHWSHLVLHVPQNLHQTIFLLLFIIYVVPVDMRVAFSHIIFQHKKRNSMCFHIHTHTRSTTSVLIIINIKKLYKDFSLPKKKNPNIPLIFSVDSVLIFYFIFNLI